MHYKKSNLEAKTCSSDFENTIEPPTLSRIGEKLVQVSPVLCGWPKQAEVELFSRFGSPFTE